MSRNKILVLHSSDSSARAETFKKWLESRDFSVSTVNDLNKSESESVYRLLQRAIEEHDRVVILVSQSLFASCVLRFGVGYALGAGKKIISIVKDTDRVIMPSWYANLFVPLNSYDEGEIWSKLKT